MSYERTIRVNGAEADSGTFPMTLATEGEASDGHILSISGGSIPKQMPLLSAHWNDPDGTLGSVIQPRKDLQSSPRELKAMGVIETGGEGTHAEQRRDLFHMIEQGHIGAVSIRWDSDQSDMTRRTELPSDHPFHVDRDKEPEGSPRRYGMFFKKWRALEGSIVAIGADPGALIGRADELEAEGASEERVAFCRALAADADPVVVVSRTMADVADARARNADAEIVAEVEGAEPVEEEPDAARVEDETEEEAQERHVRNDAEERVREILAAGINPYDLLKLTEEIADSEASIADQLERANDTITALRAELAERETQGRVDGEPPPPLPWMASMPSIFAYLTEGLAKNSAESLATIDAVIGEKRGKVERPVGVEEELYEKLKGLT